MGTRFVQNLKALGALDLDFPPKNFRYQMSAAGLNFELHPSNLVRSHTFLSCKNAEIFVVILQVVSNLAKISVSVPSISWGVLGLENIVWIWFHPAIGHLLPHHLDQCCPKYRFLVSFKSDIDFPVNIYKQNQLLHLMTSWNKECIEFWCFPDPKTQFQDSFLIFNCQ